MLTRIPLSPEERKVIVFFFVVTPGSALFPHIDSKLNTKFEFLFFLHAVKKELPEQQNFQGA